jgi:methionyl-tRNA formyltransferase
MTIGHQPAPDRRPIGERHLRAIYMGMLNGFSVEPLMALLAAGVEVSSVVVPAIQPEQLPDDLPIKAVQPEPQRSPLPIVNPYLSRNIVHIAWEHGIPVFEIGYAGAPQTLALFVSLRADVVCVACFPERLPAPLLALAPLGFLNVHPSLLPAHRGPAPLFWTFRNGERSSGVTVHFMDEGLDTGDIALQAPITLPDGISGTEADRMCSMLGARLLIDAVQALQRGTLARRSPGTGGTYEPWPSMDDFTISMAWPARRAFNFMRGTAEWGQSYVVESSGERLLLKAALSYAADERLDAPYHRTGQEVRIQFTPGVLRARPLKCVIK